MRAAIHSVAPCLLGVRSSLPRRERDRERGRGRYGKESVTVRAEHYCASLKQRDSAKITPSTTSAFALFSSHECQAIVSKVPAPQSECRKLSFATFFAALIFEFLLENRFLFPDFSEFSFISVTTCKSFQIGMQIAVIKITTETVKTTEKKPIQPTGRKETSNGSM